MSDPLARAPSPCLSGPQGVCELVCVFAAGAAGAREERVGSAVPTPGWSPALCGQRGGISHHPRRLRSLFILLSCDLFLKRPIGPLEHLNLSFTFTLNKTLVPCEIGNRTTKPEVPVASAAHRPRTGLV